jgi:hypothetical protein
VSWPVSYATRTANGVRVWTVAVGGAVVMGTWDGFWLHRRVEMIWRQSLPAFQSRGLCSGGEHVQMRGIGYEATGQRSGFLRCAVHGEAVICFGRNDDFSWFEEKTTTATTGAKATATAKSEMRGSLHCGGKSAASGRDDRVEVGYFPGVIVSVAAAVFWRTRERRTVVARMMTMTPSDRRGPMSIQWAVSILRAAKASTAARP